MNTKHLNEYHKHITGTYDARSQNHDASEWHKKTALKLVENLPPIEGDCVLDVGTGTGTIAYRSSLLVGKNGEVIGIDLSKGMIDMANGKLSESKYGNLAFILGDAERLNFPECKFDKIYCASAFFCILEPLKTLQHWHRLLKHEGVLCFHALPESSYIWVSLARDILAKYGFPYRLNSATGTLDKSKQLLVDAGFNKIDIREEKSGYFITLDQAVNSWMDSDSFAPGQYPHPLHDVPADILDKCRNEYISRIKELATKDGVWNDISMYYIFAHK